MSLADDFAAAQIRVKTLTERPSNGDLLELYALFKQGTTGDVRGKRPSMMDFKGRAKFDTWASKKGMTNDAAQAAYISLVERLFAGA